MGGSRESDECAPIAAYPVSKLAAERFLLSIDGLDVRVLRLPFVYGDGDAHIAEALPMMRTFPPTQRISLGHHVDIAQAVALILDAPSPTHRIYNVCDDEAPDNATLFASAGESPPDGSEPERARAFEAVRSARTSASSPCSRASPTHSPRARSRTVAGLPGAALSTPTSALGSRVVPTFV